MDAVRLDPYGIQNAADHKEALARFIESELEAIETNLKDQLDSQSACTVNGIGTINLYRFLNFLITEEFNPQQGFQVAGCTPPGLCLRPQRRSPSDRSGYP